jgi:hypothetical protein
MLLLVFKSFAAAVPPAAGGSGAEPPSLAAALDGGLPARHPSLFPYESCP